MPEKINLKLQSFLKMQNISQKDFAEKTGITESAISRYIKGDRVPRGVNLIKIANALEVTVDELLDNIDTSEPQNDFKSIKAIIARNAQNLSLEEKMEILSILMKKEVSK